MAIYIKLYVSNAPPRSSLVQTLLIYSALLLVVIFYLNTKKVKSMFTLSTLEEK